MINLQIEHPAIRFSLFAPYARLWIDHKVTQQFSDIEKPSSSK